MQAETIQAIRICPSCGARLNVDASRLRKKLQCPKCLHAIPSPAPDAAAEQAPPASPAAPAPSVQPVKDQVRDLEAERDRYKELASHAARLASENAALKTSLDQATATIAETAAMIARIKDLDARLNTLGADYIRALCRDPEGEPNRERRQ